MMRGFILALGLILFQGCSSIQIVKYVGIETTLKDGTVISENRIKSSHINIGGGKGDLGDSASVKVNADGSWNLRILTKHQVENDKTSEIIEATGGAIGEAATAGVTP